VEFHPISPERLPDLARFSRQHGKFRHCSCVRWRLTSTEFKRSTKETRTAALEELVRHCTPIGVQCLTRTRSQSAGARSRRAKAIAFWRLFAAHQYLIREKIRIACP
jgi:hypothetical protein